MPSGSKAIVYSSAAVVLALLVVGAVSHGLLRHAVQTLPLWIPIVLGLRRGELAKWAALPCMVFWLAIMTLIWLFLLGWARIVSGHFSAVEIAMTLAVGAACLLGISLSLRWKTSTRPFAAWSMALLSAALQLLAFRVSLFPFIATH